MEVEDLNPKKLADQVLEAYWDIDYFPVNPFKIAVDMGIKLKLVSFPKEEKVSGALLKEEGYPAIIGIEKDEPRSRQRFSCAHELGHYVSRIERKETNNKYRYIDYRSPSSSSGKEPEEIFANQFAAHLLMPNDFIRRSVKKGYSIYWIAETFGVSLESVKHKLNYLRLSCG